MPVRDHRIDVRVTESQKTAISRAARKNGCRTASALIRAVMTDYLRQGITDAAAHRSLAGIELLLKRLNAKLQQIVFLKSREPMAAQFSTLAADVGEVVDELKIAIQKLEDFPRSRRGRGDASGG